MSKIKITGSQKFMGLDIPVVLGGFGEGKKCISDKTIAEIHGQPVFEIRRRIGDNIKRFSEGVDFIDMKQRMGESHTLEFLLSLGYAKQSITQAEHIYILSERGYAKLIKIMDTDLAWEVHDKLVDDYFQLREERTQLAYIDAATLNSLAKAGNLIWRTMKDEKAAPHETAAVIDSLFKQGGVILNDQFVKIPEFRQMNFDDFMK